MDGYMMNFRMFMVTRWLAREICKAEQKKKLSIADNFKHERVISLQIVKEALQKKLYLIRQKKKSGDFFLSSRTS